MTTMSKPKANYEAFAWKWMRYSGFLLIPLAWGHVLIQDVIVGVHAIDIDYVAMRWASLGWQVYDILLLAFAFAHGMNGLRQVALDFVHSEQGRRRPLGGKPLDDPGADHGRARYPGGQRAALAAGRDLDAAGHAGPQLRHPHSGSLAP